MADKKAWKETGMSALAVIGGVMVGTALKKALAKTTESVEGLAGQVSNYVVPAILTVGGVAANGMTKNPILKNVALGVTAVGGAGVINEAMGRSVVALGNTGVVVGRRPLGLPTDSGAITIPRQIPAKTIEPVFNSVNGVNGAKGDLVPGMGTTIDAGAGFQGVY